MEEYVTFDDFETVKTKQQEQIEELSKKVGLLLSEVEELRKEHQESACKHHHE